MFSEFHALTWSDFDEAVSDIAEQLSDKDNLVGVYGVPRGGLILAVALSHRLRLPLLELPQLNALWVDDIVDTGRTIFNSPRQVLHATWINNLDSNKKFGQEIICSQSNVEGWVVFPWERLDKAKKDKERYDLSRK